MGATTDVGFVWTRMLTPQTKPVDINTALAHPWMALRPLERSLQLALTPRRHACRTGMGSTGSDEGVEMVVGCAFRPGKTRMGLPRSGRVEKEPWRAREERRTSARRAGPQTASRQKKAWRTPGAIADDRAWKRLL